MAFSVLERIGRNIGIEVMTHEINIYMLFYGAKLSAAKFISGTMSNCSSMVRLKSSELNVKLLVIDAERVFKCSNICQWVYLLP